MDIDYRLAFDLAPVGLALSRNRSILDCNQHLCDIFGTTRERLIGQSFQVLYPSADEFERTGARISPILNRSGTYADDRIMRRMDGRLKGETFWCHVASCSVAMCRPARSIATPRTPRASGVLKT